MADFLTHAFDHWAFCALCTALAPVLYAGLDWAHRAFLRFVGEE